MAGIMVPKRQVQHRAGMVSMARMMAMGVAHGVSQSVARTASVGRVHRMMHPQPLARESFRVTARLNTRAPGCESRRSATK